jgi:lipopolysaccharide/colanic/teichoic acid biosynthesis glycosyltransferase
MSSIAKHLGISNIKSLDSEIICYIDKNCSNDFISQSILLKTSNKFNIEVLDRKEKCIINLSRLNNVRRVNKFIEAVNQKLVMGGVYIGCAETIADRKEKLFRKYPWIILMIIHPLDFIYKRVIPKLPLIKRAYFAITNGHNRLMSKAEILGRLISCGFKIENIQTISGRMYFSARKINKPTFDMDVSYGPIFKMRRIGKNKNKINVYKLRTMHPYAEYLQDFIINENKLQDSGKIANDYRITSWGRVFRKMWIDELPMLINWVKGDLKLFGVRPLSQSYFNRYPIHLQELRTKTKPGLVPPYYADLPKSWEEIIDSEERYLNAYLKHPFSTDVKYFFKACYNIIIKGKRSG